MTEMTEMAKQRNAKPHRIGWADWIMPVAILAVGFFLGWYVLHHPTDSIVSNFSHAA